MRQDKGRRVVIIDKSKNSKIFLITTNKPVFDTESLSDQIV